MKCPPAADDDGEEKHSIDPTPPASILKKREAVTLNAAWMEWMVVVTKEVDRKLAKRYFVVIDKTGNLMLFDDESMNAMATFDDEFVLGKLSLSNFTVIEPNDDFPLSRLLLQSQGEELEFIMESEGNLRGFIQSVTRYLGHRGNGISVLSLF